MMQVQHLLKRHLEQHRAMFAAHFTEQQHSAVMSFVQQPVAAKSYSSQSGAIFGILKQMKETFETNLADQTKDESHATEEFGSMKSAKTKEMAAAKDNIDSNKAELAATKQQLSDDKTDLSDTRAALEADTIFLDDLKSKCANMDKAWEERSKMRADEITAVSETIKILDADEAHDTFSKSLGFLQRSAGEAKLRSRVSTYLLHQSSKLQAPKLAMLA